MRRHLNDRRLSRDSPKVVIFSIAPDACDKVKFLFRHVRSRVMFVALLILIAATCQVTWISDRFHSLLITSYVHPNTGSSRIEYSKTTTTTIAGIQDEFLAEENSSHLSSSPSSNYAYTFVIGGCDPSNPTYRNYIYNILIAVKNLREFGSRADVVAFFQMTWNSNTSVLPIEDQRLLNAMDIKIKYIPKNKQQSFYRTMLDKFRVLGLTEYESVILLDGDIIPMGNLDYLFEMSHSGMLRSNVVMQGNVAPMNGGFFLVKTGGLPEINQIIKKRQVEALEMGYPYFNLTSGWGHVFNAPDHDIWESKFKKNGTDWSFHGAFADQGLLLYWVKYVQKDVSICLLNGTVQNWFADRNGNLVVRNIEKPFENEHSKILKCWGRYCKSPPMSNYFHFTGHGKPWLRGPPENLNPSTYLDSARHYWFWQLGKLNAELQIGLNFSDWKPKQLPTLGLWPRPQDVVNASVDLLSSIME